MEGASIPAVEVKPQVYSALERAMGLDKTPALVPPAVALQAAATAQTAKPIETPTVVPQATAPAVTPEKPAEFNIDSLTDDQINELIEKKTGRKVSLADLNKPEPKTPAELEQEAIRRKEEALSWAIDNKKITQKQYEDAVIGKNMADRDLALSVFTKELQAEDKDITKEEAEEIFRDAYHEGDPESKLYKVGQKDIKKFADAYRKENFGIMDEVESDYNEFATLQGQYRDYKTTVKKLGGDLPKELEFTMPYQYLDGEKSDIVYKIPVDETIFKKLLNDASSEAAFLNENTAGKFDEKMLSKKLMYNLKASMYDIVISKLLEENTREVEKRMEVVLGNKRMPGAQINNGQQNTAKPAPKQNVYSALDRAMSQRR